MFTQGPRFSGGKQRAGNSRINLRHSSVHRASFRASLLAWKFPAIGGEHSRQGSLCSSTLVKLTCQRIEKPERAKRPIACLVVVTPSLRRALPR